MRRARAALAAALTAGLSACGSCGSRGESNGRLDAAPSSSVPSVVAEALPRCRRDADKLALPGDDVVVGDVAAGPDGLLVGLVRGEGGKRLASVLRASLDLKTSRVVDVGPSFGDDPPPSPRWNGAVAEVGFLGRTAADGGPKLRTLSLAKLGDGGLGRVDATVIQQADESTAYDIAWTEGGAGLAAWDEDAPMKDDGGAWLTAYGARGFVKVQPLGDPAARPRVASPETADAESPKLLPRPSSVGGGFWLAWLAQRIEEDSQASARIEGPGESRSFRWVDVTTLDARGGSAGPVRRISPSSGRSVGFDLARSGDDLVVLVEDETERSEGAGSMITRYVVRDGRVEESATVLDGGVGHGLAELVPVAPAASAHWLAFSDTSEHAHLAALGAGLVAQAPPTLEPALDGARVVAAAAPNVVYAISGSGSVGKPLERPELRKLLCALQ
jgi:hypothetical protein